MKIYQVDAFTNEYFSGNPAAVCILKEARDDQWLANVAKEMNLSETAFLYKQDEGYNLRWFTPSSEVDLCGHATLASAHILWEQNHLNKSEVAKFYTHSGLLTAKLNEDWIELDFPSLPEQESSVSSKLIEALGVKPKYVGKSKFDYLVEVESEKIVRDMKPDFTLLATIPIRGIIVTSIADTGEYDFVSRFFAPEVGVFEDPVTGSAHCCLGPYWQKKLGKNKFLAYQASERGGFLKVNVCGERVKIAGQAITVLEGEILG